MAKNNGQTGPKAVSEQVASLKDLHQGAAGYLLGPGGPRVLRDRPDAPRKANGKYDARELVEWINRNGDEAKLNDLEIERTLLLAHGVGLGVGTGVLGFAWWMDHLQQEHGVAGVVAVVRFLVKYFRDYAAEHPHDYRHVDPERSLFSTHVRCLKCGRIRHGTQWREAEPIEGWDVLGEFCPKCGG